jgi:formylglycine-generating enzyme required for sulfatase activity
LIVGIDEYAHLPKQGHRRFAVRDALSVRVLLTDRFGFPEDHIITLLDSAATKEGVQSALSTFADVQTIDENDRVFIFYSGHGQTVRLHTGEEMGFLVTYDAQIDLTDPVPDPEDYYRTCVGMDELRDISSLIPAKHVLFVVDACYSALTTRPVRGIPIELSGYLEKITSVPARQFITAGVSGEQVIEKDGRSVFTAKLIEALEHGLADTAPPDGYTTATELGAHLSWVVPDYAEKRQHPHFGQLDGEGEFVFRHAESPTRPVVSSQPEAWVIPAQSVAPDTQPPPGLNKRVGTAPSILFIEPTRSGAGTDSWSITPATDRVHIVGVAKDPDGIARITINGRSVSTLDRGTIHWFEAIVHVSGQSPQRMDVRAEDRSGNVAVRTLFIEPTDSVLDLPEGMMLIPAGMAWVGSNDGEDDERQQHRVKVDSFLIDKHEVTVGQYREFVGADGWREPDWKAVAKYSPSDRHPMVLVTWADASAYGAWLDRRLPTEAEWEKAARGGLMSEAYPWGSMNEADRANSSGTEQGDRWRFSAPVGSFPPNEYGLYDTAGNVWEWCSDWYHADYYRRSPPSNPRGPRSGRSRVIRGGSWDHALWDLRVSRRRSLGPNAKYGDLGFRCAMDVPGAVR